MRRLQPAVVLLFLAGCSIERTEEADTVTDNKIVTVTSGSPGASPKSFGKGQVIDQVGVFRPEEMEALAGKLADLERAGGPRATLIMVRPSAGESMEQIGWAVAGQTSRSAVTLLVDVDKAVVRVEGPLPPERKAAVASAMQADLLAKRYPEAAQSALAVLGA